MPAGRPLKFRNQAEVATKIDDYFKACAEDKRPLTITGLALALDTNRETLLDYQGREEYSDTIKRAKQIVQNYVEEYLFTGKNVAGAIFNLKNNYNWKERTETDITTKGESINPDPTKAADYAEYLKNK